jgi:hypothetical protein
MAGAEVLAELALIAAGELTVEITARYPLEQVWEAYASWHKVTPGAGSSYGCADLSALRPGRVASS